MDLKTEQAIRDLCQIAGIPNAATSMIERNLSEKEAFSELILLMDDKTNDKGVLH